MFLPKDTELAAGYMDIIRQETEKAGLTLFHIREVPVDSNVLGAA